MEEMTLQQGIDHENEQLGQTHFEFYLCAVFRLRIRRARLNRKKLYRLAQSVGKLYIDNLSLPGLSNKNNRM